MLRSAPRLLAAALLLIVCTASLADDQVDGDYKSAFVMDYATGDTLFSANAHLPLPPASMVKMMTELIVLEHIGMGELGMDDVVTVSRDASGMGGSQVYLRTGETFSVHDLLMALAIHSANDAAVALAEHLAGSTDAFVELMNLRARELGMNDTRFHFVHGLPPARGQEPDLSSAHDMALLGRELAHHDEALAWAVMDQVPFRGGAFLLTNPNPLVGKYRGLEGIKTGYHDDAGFCLTAAATQKGVRLISVVMGAPDNESRGRETTRLLSRGFAQYTRLTLVPTARDPLPDPVAVKGGAVREVALLYAAPLEVGVRKEQSEAVRLEHRLPAKLDAPLSAGQVVGKAVATADGKVLGETPIIVAEDVEKGSLLQRLLHH